MRKPLLLMAALMLGGTMIANADEPRGGAPSWGESTFKWLPTKVNEFNKDPMQGNAFVQTGYTEYAYDAQERVVSETEYLNDGQPASRTLYTYDTTDPTLVVSCTESRYEGGQWVEDPWSSWSLTITRDAAGNITNATRSVHGDMETMDVEYGTDGRPSKITVVQEAGTPNAETGVYTDLTWYTWNGTIILFDDMDDMNDYVGTPSTPKTAKFSNEDVDQVLDVTAYDPATGNYSFLYTETEKYSSDSDVTEKTITVTYSDENGSYTRTEERKEWPVDQPTQVETDNYTTTATFDQWGVCTSYKDIEPSYTHEEKWTVTYAQADPFAPVRMEDENSRLEFEGVNTGIECIPAATDDTNAPVEYYNLQGQRLPAAPATGLYIRRQGTHAATIFR